MIAAKGAWKMLNDLEIILHKPQKESTSYRLSKGPQARHVQHQGSHQTDKIQILGWPPHWQKSKKSVENGRRIGGDLWGRPNASPRKESPVLRLRKEGQSYRSIKDQIDLAFATITRIKKRSVGVILKIFIGARTRLLHFTHPEAGRVSGDPLRSTGNEIPAKKIVAPLLHNEQSTIAPIQPFNDDDPEKTNTSDCESRPCQSVPRSWN